MTGGGWLKVAGELARLRQDGRAVSFWLRDDDAIEPTMELDRLLDLTQEYGVPVAVATVPATSGEALGQRLAAARHATPVAHGWSHANHALPDEKKQELGLHRGADTVLADLSAALRRMQQLHGSGFYPMLVPPWNRIDPALLPHLASLGYAALSCFGSLAPQASVPVFNTHVDVIDWRGGRGGRSHEELVSEVNMHLRRAGQGGGPIGILTHHLVHNEAAWSFLARLFDTCAQHGGCRWLAVRDLAPAHAGAPGPEPPVRP